MELRMMDATQLPKISSNADEQIKLIEKHDILVRIAHWTNIPILTALIMSGFSIYWASPVITIPTSDGNKDLFAILGGWFLKYFPNSSEDERNWFYDHFAFGSRSLASALNIHWLCAYLFMIVAVLYVLGLARSGAYKALLPRPSDLPNGLKMFLYYLKVFPCFILRKPNPHPVVTSKYNALQRTAYFSVSVVSLLSILTGWAIHKPAQLGWLQAAFGGYDLARLWHFLAMLFFLSFVVPHVFLVAVDGVDTFRSMVVGWSDRTKELSDE
jgi:thiosulfate reductase cytochrome b subunit